MKQGVTFYNQDLAAFFPSNGAAALLKDTPTEKSLYFLKHST